MLVILNSRGARVVTFGCICHQPQVDFVHFVASGPCLVATVRADVGVRTATGNPWSQRDRENQRQTPGFGDVAIDRDWIEGKSLG